MIGDPGGRSEERNLLDADTLAHNVARIKAQLSTLLDFEPGPYAATLVNNADWTSSLGMLDFLRDVGKHFTVNQMIAKDSVRSRIDSEHGISYTEFSYMLLQANDFRHLYEAHGVELQAGASDQWGNIVAGVELIRRRLGAAVHAVTHPLMLRSDGQKFGKSVGGAVWLDPQRTSPYQFRQFWVQTDDQLVGVYLKMLSMRPVAELDELLCAHQLNPGQRAAQRALADEMTALVHGERALQSARAAAEVLFGGDPSTVGAEVLEVVAAEVPCVDVETIDGIRVHELLVGAGVAASNSEVNRLLQQGAVRVGSRVVDADGLLEASDVLPGGFVLLRKGKRDFVAGKIFTTG
jgi:tyrosyl-tRNA synthetase